ISSQTRNVSYRRLLTCCAGRLRDTGILTRVLESVCGLPLYQRLATRTNAFQLPVDAGGRSGLVCNAAAGSLPPSTRGIPLAKFRSVSDFSPDHLHWRAVAHNNESAFNPDWF